MLRRHAAAPLLAVLFALPLVAQVSEVQPGARVRVTAPGIVAGDFVGTVLTRTADTIAVGGPNVVPIHIPWARISSLEISRGKSRADGAIVGIKWGAPLMAAVGATLGIAGTGLNDRCTQCDDISLGEAVSVTALFALSGAFYGAGIGAIVGRERWDQFDVGARTSLRIDRGRIGIGMQFGF
jgi:hypothetical protein